MVEWIEPTGIAAIVGIGIAIISLGITIYQNYKQSRVVSANLSFEMAKLFRTERFSVTLDYLETGKLPNPNWNVEVELEILLTHLEDIGLFVSDGVINEHHVLEMYSYTLKLIKDSEDCKRIFARLQKEKPNFYFMYVQKLLNRV